MGKRKFGLSRRVKNYERLTQQRKKNAKFRYFFATRPQLTFQLLCWEAPPVSDLEFEEFKEAITLPNEEWVISSSSKEIIICHIVSSGQPVVSRSLTVGRDLQWSLHY